MSDTEECQSMVPETHQMSNDYINQASVDRSHENKLIDRTGNCIGKTNHDKRLLEKYPISTIKEEIMDSEVSSITSKEEPALEDISCDETDENEEKSPDVTAFSGRISSDFETAALSPCFPLIRDRDELDIDKTEKEPVSNNYAEAKRDIREKESYDIIDTIGALAATSNDILRDRKIYENKAESEQNKMVDDSKIYSIKESVNDASIDSEMYQEKDPEARPRTDEKFEPDKYKDNVVSSSLDKNNDVTHEKESASSQDIW